MKNLLLILFGLLATSCAGTKTRDEVVLPITMGVWSDVKADLQRGLEDGLEDGDLGETEHLSLVQTMQSLEMALASKNRLDIATIPWSVLDPWALRGIQDRLDDGEIGPGVAQSLVEQVNLFRLSLAKLGSRIAFVPEAVLRDGVVYADQSDWALEKYNRGIAAVLRGDVNDGRVAEGYLRVRRRLLIPETLTYVETL